MKQSILIVLLAILSQPVFASSTQPVHVGVQVDRIEVSKQRTIKPAKELPQPKSLYGTKKPKTHHTGRVVQSKASNERAVWDYLIARYSRNQTAGIMGNLRQEHHFQTSGDGLAQWTGGRKARLMSISNPYSLNTQLNFLVKEMKEMGLVLPNTVEGATIAFQNKFERCGRCMQSQRIRYAYDILSRY